MLWSYMIISALLRRSKTLDAKASAEHHTLLIVTLAGSVCAEICGFTAFWALLLVKFPDGSFDYTGLAAQIAVMSLGWKSLAESLALSRMFDIAPGKQRAFGFSTRVVKLVSKIPTAMSSKEQNVLEVVRHRISIMGRLPTEWLSRPLNIASFVFAAATTSGNLCVAALIVVRLLRRWTGAWHTLVLLAILNIISAILQLIVIYETYWEPAARDVTYRVESISIGLLFLGFGWTQLELRFIFGVLFASRPEDIWTPVAKTRARIGLVLAHFTLLVSVGTALHAILTTFVGGAQAYIFTTALLRTSKKLSATDTTGCRNQLIGLMCLSVLIHVAGIAAFCYGSLFFEVTSNTTLNLFWLIYQFSLACLACEAVFQALSLITMTDLVAGKAMRFNDFVQAHRPQLASVPKTLWKPIHRKLCWDTEPSELDLLVVDEARWGVTASSSLTEPLDPESQVFVVDNIIAFTREGLRETLGNDDKAAERLRAALSRRGLDVSTEAGLMRGVWLVADAAQMTVLGADGKPQTQYLWYVPGEQIIGMAHSDEPNFESRIFFDMIRMVPVMLLWPTKPVQPGEPCTRNLLAACRDAQERLALMFAWLLEHELADPALPQQIREAALAPDPPSIVDLRGEEAATDAKSDGEEARKLLPPKDEYLVFSPDVAKHLFKASLDGSRFKLTTNADEADIIWTAESFDRTKLKQGQFVNAFPNQSAIVVKDLLRECVYRYWGQSRAAAWFPRTFNLNYETLDFIGAFIDGSAKQPDSNVWIIKPWNGTRSEGITVSNWMPEILKQMVSGPKIASKYVHPPALLDGKFKFDLRVLVVVDSVEPLRMFTVPSAIYAREAHVEYDHRLEKLDSFENHFTVMSYRGLPVVRSPLPEIVQRMEACFASRSASFERDLLPRMLAVIRKGIEAAVGVGRAEREAGWSGPTKGMLPDAQAKSLYGADVMFDSEMNAYLLEVSAVPDTGRVMDVWPTLYSDLFEFLFAGSDKASSRFVAF
ncbi:hypothetical protein HK105_203109 [Polyrhizophydium stewartii]|uniref:Uncharacterized protein n=1 Tax=Polyrhizophydium stewartii TaxID=2732419 RepID=A0ABR4ND29_9FUNG